jgi:hypothetical protein
MKQWFYVKNDLSKREDVRGIIQRPIRSRFGFRRLSIASGNKVQACLMAFNMVCTYIGTRDLVQEHIAYKMWSLVNDWEMLKETAVGSSEGGLVYLRYTYPYRNQFDESNEDWLEAIKATSDELLGAYTKAEDEAMTTAFGARGKRRLNRVFDVIGFFILITAFLSENKGQREKMTTLSSSIAPKPKRAKVLTHRLKPHSLERIATIPDTKRIEIAEQAKATPLALKTIPAMTVEASAGPAEESETKSTKAEEHSKLLSPPTTTRLPKLTTTAITTPKKRRMASVLDVVLKSTKILTPASTEAPEDKAKDLREVSIASAFSAHIEAETSGAKPAELAKESLHESPTLPAHEAPSQVDLEYIVRHASGKKLSKEQVIEVQHYARDLKYPRGSLVYGGSDEDDFLYCLPDNKEINVCQEMMDNMRYPKLELGLSTMTKDQLADNLVYNNMKVCIFCICIW